MHSVYSLYQQLKISPSSVYCSYKNCYCMRDLTVERLCRAGPRGRTTLGVHPLSWLLRNNRQEKVPFVSVPHTSSNRLLLSNQDKGCTPSVAHSLALPLGPALHNLLSINWTHWHYSSYYHAHPTPQASLCSWPGQMHEQQKWSYYLTLTHANIPTALIKRIETYNATTINDIWES